MKCECYHKVERIQQIANPLTGGTMPHRVKVDECWGTKDKDVCFCGGDKSKCDFYQWDEQGE